jgi:hypothetical protein
VGVVLVRDKGVRTIVELLEDKKSAMERADYIDVAYK